MHFFFLALALQYPVTMMLSKLLKLVLSFPIGSGVVMYSFIIEIGSFVTVCITAWVPLTAWLTLIIQVVFGGVRFCGSKRQTENSGMLREGSLLPLPSFYPIPILNSFHSVPIHPLEGTNLISL